jgi:hypothetical protein
MPKSFLVILGLALPLAGCATGKSEVPDCVKRYTGMDCGCHAGGLGSMSVVTQVNKTVAGATVGAVKSSAHAVTNSFCDPAGNLLYAPVAIVGGVFTGIADGMGHVPAVQSCHYNFGPTLAYAWNRDYRTGTADAQVPEHRATQWNGGAYWPGGPR